MTQEHAMKRILTTVLFSAIVAGSAVAADLPPAPPPRAPVVYAPPPPVYSWTGFYIGINGGWGFGKSDWTFDNFSTGNFNVNGGVLGATAGFNWQSDWFVAGLEGDADGSWMDGKSAACVPVTTNGAQCETKNKWLATLRGRIGYAADRVLFYATGGVAFGDVVVNTAANWQTDTKTGWTAGAGIEGENSSFTAVNGVGASVPVTVKFNTSLIRAGVDYKF
jgi:outer membrane immunogenic protein